MFDKILETIANNIRNNKPHNNLQLQEIKEVSKNLCNHCKVGICLNDSCYSI